jgi:hypothetical protein
MRLETVSLSLQVSTFCVIVWLTGSSSVRALVRKRPGLDVLSPVRTDRSTVLPQKAGRQLKLVRITSAPAPDQPNCDGHHGGDGFSRGDFHPRAEKPIKASLRGREQKQGLGVVLAVFHRVWPLVGLTLALVSTVGWIALLGYVAIKLL